VKRIDTLGSCKIEVGKAGKAVKVIRLNTAGWVYLSVIDKYGAAQTVYLDDEGCLALIAALASVPPSKDETA